MEGGRRPGAAYHRRGETEMADHEEIAHAMGRWREGERLLSRHTSLGWVAAYQQAVGRGLAHLQRYTTMAELVATYFEDAANGEKERWLAVACTTKSGRVLNVGIVEDAAFWRRAQQLARE